MSKDVVNSVLFQQFEKYLIAKGLRFEKLSPEVAIKEGRNFIKTAFKYKEVREILPIF